MIALYELAIHLINFGGTLKLNFLLEINKFLLYLFFPNSPLRNHLQGLHKYLAFYTKFKDLGNLILINHDG